MYRWPRKGYAKEVNMERSLVKEKLLKDVNNFGIKGMVMDSESGRFYTWDKEKMFSIQRIKDNGISHSYFFIPWIRVEQKSRHWYRYFKRFKIQGAISINKCVTFKDSLSGMLSRYKKRRKVKYRVRTLEVIIPRYRHLFIGKPKSDWEHGGPE
jgi:hypothetical protein